MAVKIAPSMRQQFEDANGNPYVGGKLFTYAAGSSTKQATYTDSTGLSANTNPIILDSAGRTPYGVWLTSGLNYKFVLALSSDTDPPSSSIFTEDMVSGVNDTAITTSQWIAAGVTSTYISATQFTLIGDKTADFHVGRRLKFTVTAGTVYGLITASAYTTLTTVTVVTDSGALDTGLSAVELSVLTNTGSALPVTSYIRGLLDDTDATTARTTLGATTLAAAMIAAWPVGSIFIATVPTDPATLLGGGTWVSFGAGRVLVGIDPTQPEFDVLEETGGSKTHTLTTAEIPSHFHSGGMTAASLGGGAAGSAVGTGPIDTGATGGGAAHNNLQPYIVVYMWKRTA